MNSCRSLRICVRLLPLFPSEPKWLFTHTHEGHYPQFLAGINRLSITRRGNFAPILRQSFRPAAQPVYCHDRGRLLVAVRSGQVDVAVSVHGKDEAGLHYSDGMVDYINYAITRKEDRIRLTGEGDLDQYRFVIWQRGWADLGPAFEARYKPDDNGQFRPNYFQSSTQDAQSRVFWARRVDVIVVDRHVFEWYRRQLAASMKVDDEVEYHDIFKSTAVFAAAFADRDTRDRFNGTLKVMRADGSYQDILNRYK